MTPLHQDVRQTVLKFYPAFDTGEVGNVLEFLSPTWEDLPAGAGQRPGADGYQDMITRLRGFMPDCRLQLKDVILDGDRVAVHSTISGSPRGHFLGLYLSGRTVHMMTVDIHAIVDGRIATTWHVEDRMGMISQLGRPHLTLHPPVATPSNHPARPDGTRLVPVDKESSRD